MTQQKRRRIWLAPGLVLAGAMTGCHNSEPFQHEKAAVDLPPPTGTYVHEFEAVQTGKAKASHFVFFLNEWYMGGTTLGPMGSRHLQMISAEMPKTATMVFVEPCLEPDLNEKRRVTIVTGLVNNGVADAESRVKIGFPQAEGLDGEEAERIYRQYLRPPLQYGGYGGYGAIGGYGGGYGGQGGYGGGGYGGGYGGAGGLGGGGYGMGGFGYGGGLINRPGGYLP